MLLLDEPLGALDLKLRRQMQAVLKQLQREIGITFVYVTHDQEEAFSMSDRVGIMNAGRARAARAAPRRLPPPPDPVRGRLRGRVEPLPGHASSSGRRTAAFAPTWARSGRGRGGRRRRRSSRASTAVAIVRPESMAPDGDGRVGVNGAVVDVAYLGAQVQYTLDAGELRPGDRR